MCSYTNSLITTLIIATAGWWTASACHPALKVARDAAQDILEGSGMEGSGMDAEGSGIDFAEGSGESDCLLLSYACPDGEDCIEATQETPGTWSCGDDSDYSLHVADADGPYVSISCQAGEWTDPSGNSLEASLAENPTVYCQRFVPDE